MVVAWVVLAVVLLAVEMRHLAFFALFAAAGAFAAALVALAAPEAIPLQVAVAVAVAAVGIVAVRPMVSDALHRRHEGRLGRGVHGTLVGEEVLTLDSVGDLHTLGHVHLAGERWLAASGSGDTIPEGTRVVVTGVQGTTLIVWPSDGSVPPPPLPGLPGSSSPNPPLPGAEGDRP